MFDRPAYQIKAMIPAQPGWRVVILHSPRSTPASEVRPVIAWVARSAQESDSPDTVVPVWAGDDPECPWLDVADNDYNPWRLLAPGDPEPDEEEIRYEFAHRERVQQELAARKQEREQSKKLRSA